MTPTAEQIAKLPRWAREQIASLEADIRERDGIILSLKGAPTQTRVELQPRGFGDGILYQADEAKVRFYMGDNPNRQDWIDVYLPLASQHSQAYKEGHHRFPYALQLRGSSRFAVFHDSSNSSLLALTCHATQVERSGLA